MFALAARLGAPLLETTGAILLSFGLNRPASALVVQRRLARLTTGTRPDPVVGPRVGVGVR